MNLGAILAQYAPNAAMATKNTSSANTEKTPRNYQGYADAGVITGTVLDSMSIAVSGRLQKAAARMEADATEFAYKQNTKALKNEINNVYSRMLQDTGTFDINFKQSLDEQAFGYAQAGIAFTGSALSTMTQNKKMGDMQRKLIRDAADEDALTLKFQIIENEYQAAMSRISADLTQKMINFNTVTQIGSSIVNGAMGLAYMRI